MRKTATELGNVKHLTNSWWLTTWEELQVATTTTSQAQSLNCPKNGKVQNLSNCDRYTMNALNATIFAICSIHFTEAQKVT